MKSLYLILIGFFLHIGGLFAQDVADNTPNYLYKNEYNLGLFLHTRGGGVSVQFSKYRDLKKYLLLDFNVYSLKHPKEVKLPNYEIPESRPFVYGKANSPYLLNLNIGTRRILADKLTAQGVRLNLNYTVGPVIAFLKPVYYDVRIPNPDGSDPEVVESKFVPDNEQFNQNTIGQSSFFTGLGQTSFLFGGNAKTSLSFEWGPLNYKFWSLEAGAMVDVFPTELPIFAYPFANDKAFVNLFLSITYGSRR